MFFFLSNWYADQIVVLYPGQVIKTHLPKKFLTHPLHPYVHQLLNSVPSYDRRSELWSVIPGKVPNFYQLPT
jgi:peptide/nickel transport system ATP-binding protein